MRKENQLVELFSDVEQHLWVQIERIKLTDCLQEELVLLFSLRFVTIITELGSKNTPGEFVDDR